MHASVSYKKMRRRLIKALKSRNNMVISDAIEDISGEVDSLSFKIFTKGYGPKHGLNIGEQQA